MHAISETLFFLFQMPYSSRLMHAMSQMARKGGTIGALHYFDLTQKDAVSLFSYQMNFSVVEFLYRSIYSEYLLCLPPAC